jgi:hypothetical protein
MFVLDQSLSQNIFLGINKHNITMLDAFPRSAGDHLAQNFLRKI